MKTTLIVFVLIVFCAFADAEIYKWTDEKGTVHFTEDPATIPEKYRDQAKGRLTEDDLMSIEERALEKDKGEKAAKDRLDTSDKAYEESLKEERLRREQKEREYIQYKEKIRAEKEEKDRELKQTQENLDPQYVSSTCTSCFGKGVVKCWLCNGTGWFGGPFVKSSSRSRCTSCDGSGIRKCTDCN